MNRINLWRIAQIGVVLFCFGLVTSVRGQEVADATSIDKFSVSWNQMLMILGGIGTFFGTVAEFRRWIIDLDARVQRIEAYFDKKNAEEE